MLQQTQAGRVVEKYPLFLRRFPSLRSLARAKKSSVVRAWRGMGYNNRAIRLQQLARIVQQEHGGRLPRDIDALQRLPGIGRYTAHAIACFAFHRQVPAADTNVRRVLARLFPAESKHLDIWDIAAHVLPAKRAHDWNQALFDFGSALCTERSPKCDVCPVSKLCPSAFKTERRRPQISKQEPGRDGLANRIYRGRIVETLRNLKNKRTIASERLGRQIKERFTRRDTRWLFGLLRALENDGVVTLRNGSSTLKVSLAE